MAELTATVVVKQYDLYSQKKAAFLSHKLL